MDALQQILALYAHSPAVFPTVRVDKSDARFTYYGVSAQADPSPSSAVWKLWRVDNTNQAVSIALQPHNQAQGALVA